MGRRGKGARPAADPDVHGRSSDRDRRRSASVTRSSFGCRRAAALMARTSPSGRQLSPAYLTFRASLDIKVRGSSGRARRSRTRAGHFPSSLRRATCVAMAPHPRPATPRASRSATHATARARRATPELPAGLPGPGLLARRPEDHPQDLPHAGRRPRLGRRRRPGLTAGPSAPYPHDAPRGSRGVAQGGGGRCCAHELGRPLQAVGYRRLRGGPAHEALASPGAQATFFDSEL